MEQAATEEAVELAALDDVLVQRTSNGRGKKDGASGSYRSELQGRPARGRASGSEVR